MSISFRYILTMSFMISLIGCGGTGGVGAGAGAGIGAGAGGNVIDPTFSINIADVTGYDDTDPIDVQYLSVINYLRSQSITCNDATAASGPVGPMVTNDILVRAAKEHSDDMGISGNYSHTGSGTASDVTGQIVGHASSLTERLNHNGYSNSMWGENIAMRWGSSAAPADAWIEIMAGWMTSATGHCSNIMSSRLSDFGMSEYIAPVDGAGKYYVYWTQDFGG